MPAQPSLGEWGAHHGSTAGRWAKIGIVHGADSFTNHREHVFVATICER